MKKRFKLVLDVTFDDVAEEHVESLRANLEWITKHAFGEGLLTTEAGEAVVDTHEVRITELTPLEGVVVKKAGGLELLEDGNVRGIVRVNVADFTENDSVLEKYMDILSDKLVGTCLLSDIRDQVVDVEDGAILVVEVEGSPSMIDMPEGPLAELVGKESHDG